MKNRPNILKCNRWFILAVALMTLTLLLASACAKPAPLPPPPPPVNKPPIIQSVNSENIGGSGKQYKVSCNATDPDNDTLSYVWTFDNETVYGRNITLRPGRAGNFTLGLKVSDGIDEASASWTVEVTKPPPVVVPKTKIKNDSAVANMALALVIALMAVTVVSALILRNALKPKNKEEPGHKK